MWCSRAVGSTTLLLAPNAARSSSSKTPSKNASKHRHLHTLHQPPQRQQHWEPPRHFRIKRQADFGRKWQFVTQAGWTSADLPRAAGFVSNDFRKCAREKVSNHFVRKMRRK
jgi:hypothetical protein